MLTYAPQGHGLPLSELLRLCVASRPLCEERYLACSWLRRELAACGNARTDVVLTEPVTAEDLVRVCGAEVVLCS